MRFLKLFQILQLSKRIFYTYSASMLFIFSHSLFSQDNEFFNYLTTINRSITVEEIEEQQNFSSFKSYYTTYLDSDKRINGYRFNCFDKDFEVSFLGSLMSVNPKGSKEGYLVDIGSNKFKLFEEYVSDLMLIDAIEPMIEKYRNDQNQFKVPLGANSKVFDKVNILSKSHNLGNTTISSDLKGKIDNLLHEQISNQATKSLLSFIPYFSWMFTYTYNQKGLDKQISIGRSLFWIDSFISRNPALSFLNPDMTDQKSVQVATEFFSLMLANLKGIGDLKEIRESLLESAMKFPLLPFFRDGLDADKLYQNLYRVNNITNSNDYEEDYSIQSYFKSSPYETVKSKTIHYTMFLVWFLSRTISPGLQSFTDKNDYSRKGVVTGYLLEKYFIEGSEKKYNLVRDYIYLGKSFIPSFAEMKEKVSRTKELIPFLACTSAEASLNNNRVPESIRAIQRKVNRIIVPLESHDFLMFKNRGAIEHIVQAEYYLSQGRRKKAIKYYKYAHDEVSDSFIRIKQAKKYINDNYLKSYAYSFLFERELSKLEKLEIHCHQLDKMIQSALHKVSASSSIAGIKKTSGDIK